jgi:hypothetical protein
VKQRRLERRRFCLRTVINKKAARDRTPLAAFVFLDIAFS